MLPAPAASRSESVDDLVAAFQASTPVKHVVLDDFLEAGYLEALLADLPVLQEMPKSRDYVFSDKRELSTLDTHSPVTARLHDLFVDQEFTAFLTRLVGRPVFVDPTYAGGGFHAGSAGSYLDLHADFNIHPAHPTWYRELNILLYLNPGWRAEWGGELQLTNDPAVSGIRVAPLLNRLVVMESTSTSFHGYDRIDFPPGHQRRSIAAYAYSTIAEGEVSRRTTDWRPHDAGTAKRLLAQNWNRLVLTKNKYFGSGTLKNRKG
jgi:Rps23 Pro-64 3,4-dihydroxylase Tpa1-like proline 4-hydroxylase